MTAEHRHSFNKGVIVFFALAFAISWGFWGLAIVAKDTALAPVGFYGGGFGPFLAALVVTWLSGRSPWGWFRSLWTWRVPFRFWVFTFGFPILLALLASAIHGLFGGEIVLRDIGARMVSWAPVFAAVTLIGGGNEEPGWRGFALPALQERLSPFTATLVLGVVWALWHLPLIGVRGGGFGAFWMSGPELLAAGLTLLSITTHAFWYTWLYNRTGSVLLCILLHGGYNAANARFVLVPEDSLHGADERQLLLVMTGLLVASVALLLVFTRGRLGR
ncbi:CPBP family intramembrane glutamic endopeptidase [Jiella marina]|uniref:CPBP family intramembrane glutamic endopeptidase n=1 Tax=Jiella sp. LLJ827 TaxID=2917712 RepID=UPI00210090DE|nr:type II CAAX endopeptidase family protein [Jiella sp. LLJ827]MCQ0987190.1 CPBP family intramembrane metalloprotease [Jiella sp. LLJ827]